MATSATPATPTTTGPGEFHSAGSMVSARVYHTATVLPSGLVLLAGGQDVNHQPVAAAELFDPKTGAFSQTGSMLTPRWAHTATLLPDGRVLIAGGMAQGEATLSSAELFDPAAGAFSSTGKMLTARWAHTATLLHDGRVLIAGGRPSNTGIAALSSAELYDPLTGTFSRTGSLIIEREGSTATILSDGRVLITGGWVGRDWAASAELFDPTTGTFGSTGSMTTARHEDTATLLADGRVLVVGGLDGNNIHLASAELYDPHDGTFRATGSMAAPRHGHTATVLADGRVLVAGSEESCVQPPETLAPAEMYDPRSGSFRLDAPMVGARSSHSATLLPDGRVLIAGGWNLTPLDTAETYRP